MYPRFLPYKAGFELRINPEIEFIFFLALEHLVVARATFSQFVSHVRVVQQACLKNYSGGYQISDNPIPLQPFSPLLVVSRSPEASYGTPSRQSLILAS